MSDLLPKTSKDSDSTIPLVKEQSIINYVLTINMRGLFKVSPLLILMPACFSVASYLFPHSLKSICCKDDSAACPQSTNSCEFLRKSEADLCLYLYKSLGHSYNRDGVSEREYKAQMRKGVTTVSSV